MHCGHSRSRYSRRAFPSGGRLDVSDVADFSGWVQHVRGQWPGLFPAGVVEALDQDDLRTKLADADAVMIEQFNVGVPELELAKRLKVVQKFGVIASNIIPPLARREVWPSAYSDAKKSISPSPSKASR